MARQLHDVEFKKVQVSLPVQYIVIKSETVRWLCSGCQGCDARIKHSPAVVKATAFPSQSVTTATAKRTSWPQRRRMSMTKELQPSAAMACKAAVWEPLPATRRIVVDHAPVQPTFDLSRIGEFFTKEGELRPGVDPSLVGLEMAPQRSPEEEEEVRGAVFVSEDSMNDDEYDHNDHNDHYDYGDYSDDSLDYDDDYWGSVINDDKDFTSDF